MRRTTCAHSLAGMGGGSPRPIGLQDLLDGARVTGLPSLGLRDDFFTIRRKQLRALGYLPQEKPFSCYLLLAIGQVCRPSRHRVADFIVKQDAARGTQGGE